MRCKLEHAIKDQVAALEEDVTPVPTIILHDAVCFRFDPEIERDQCDTAHPANEVSVAEGNRTMTSTYRMTWTVNESPTGTRNQENANMQYARKSLHTTLSISMTTKATFDALQENDIYQLSEQEPSVVLQRKFL